MMPIRFPVPVRLLVALPIAALLAACSGSGDDLKDALQSVTDEQLALMVLSQAELGTEANGLEIDPESGYEDAEAEAEDTLDPNDTGADLEEAGFVNIYALTYLNPAATESSGGVVIAGTGPTLFESDELASQFLNKQFDDYAELVGEEYAQGLTLESSEEFDGADLGDEARFVVLKADTGSFEVYYTLFAFRLGPLLGRGGFGSFASDDWSPQVAEIAKSLKERMEAVLRGEVGGEPTLSTTTP